MTDAHKINQNPQNFGDVNLVDTICQDSGDGLAEVYVSKRRMDTPPSVSASDAHVDKRPVAGTGQVYSGLQQATSSSQPFGAGVPVVVGAPVGGGVPSNTQMGTLPGLQGGPTVKRVVKKRTRGKARRLPVKIKKKETSGRCWMARMLVCL